MLTARGWPRTLATAWLRLPLRLQTGQASQPAMRHGVPCILSMGPDIEYKSGEEYLIGIRARYSTPGTGDMNIIGKTLQSNDVAYNRSMRKNNKNIGYDLYNIRAGGQ